MGGAGDLHSLGIASKLQALIPLYPLFSQVSHLQTEDNADSPSTSQGGPETSLVNF